MMIIKTKSQRTTLSVYKNAWGDFDTRSKRSSTKEEGEDERKKTQRKKKTETSDAAADEPPPLDELETPLNLEVFAIDRDETVEEIVGRFDEEANERCGKMVARRLSTEKVAAIREVFDED